MTKGHTSKKQIAEMEERRQEVAAENPRELIDLYEPVYEEIPVNEINPGKRERIDYGDIKDLSISIKQKGLLHNIGVLKYDKPLGQYKYFLLYGGRRLRAFIELKRETIPARILPQDLDAFEIRAIELEENLKRKPFSESERLRALKRLNDLYTERFGVKTSTAPGAKGHSQKAMARKLGISASLLSEDLEAAEILELMPELATKYPKKSDLKKRLKLAKRELQKDRDLAALEAEQKASGKNTFEIQEQSYIIGNFFTKVKEIPSNSVDFIDLDIDYPMDTDDNPLYSMLNEDIKIQNYKGISKEDFPTLMLKCLKECYRILKKDSWIIIWFGREYFKDIQTWAEQAKFRTSHYTGKWVKGVNMSHTRNPYHTLGHSMEEFFYFKKGSPELSEPRSDLFLFTPTITSQKSHPYEKPIVLLKEILRVFINPGQKIVVPFAGSGNTLIAGFNYKCSCVGFDISENYKKSYTLKLRSNIK